MPQNIPANKKPIPKNLVKISDKKPVHRPAVDTSASIRKTALMDGATDTGKWDKIFMMSDDMKCYKFSNADTLVNTRTNTYVISGQAKSCEFAEVIPELFGDQLGGAASAANAGAKGGNKGANKGKGAKKNVTPAPAGKNGKKE